MRTTVTIDDDLYAKAVELADPLMDKADLFARRSRCLCGCRRPNGWLR